MSTIVCDELKSTLTQQINLKNDRNHLIEGVKLHVVNYGSPAGTFTLSLKQGVNVLTSVSFTSNDIKEVYGTSDDYGYFYIPLVFDNFVNLKKGSYDFELSATGYTYGTSSFIGWVRSFENIFNTRENEYESFQTNPFDVLIYERRKEDIR